MSSGLTFETKKIEYNVIYSKRKTLEISIKAPGIITVRAPIYISEEQIEKSVRNKSKWIMEKLAILSKVDITSIKKEYVARRNVVIEGIKSIPGAYCPTPKGAFYVMAKLPIDDSDKFCQWLLEKFNENNETVMLAPATGFYSVPERGLQEVRISYVLNVDDMKRSMELLKKAIEVYPGRK